MLTRARRIAAQVLLATLGLMLTLPLAGCGDNAAAPAGDRSYFDQVRAAQQDPQPASRARQLIAIAAQQAQAKDSDGATRTFRLAAEAGNAVKDLPARAEVFARLAEAEAQAGDTSAARISAKAAQQAADKAHGPDAQARALAQAARALAAAGLRDQAAAALKTAESQLAAEAPPAKPSPDDDGSVAAYERVLALATIAQSYHRLGEKEPAARLAAQAQAVAKGIANPRASCNALAEIGIAQHAVGDVAANANFDLALDTARKIPKPFTRAYALTSLAEKFAKAGLRDRSQTTIAEADVVAHQVPETDLQQQTIEKVRKTMDLLGVGS